MYFLKKIGGISISKKEFKKGKASVLFADVESSTEISEIYGPEKTVKLLDGLFDKFESSIIQRSGRVDKLLGDGILAYFWNEEDSSCGWKAISCAQDFLEKDLPKLGEETSINIGLRIGISTGEILRANMAGIENTIMGGAVNLASRLENKCKEFGSNLLVDDSTYRCLGDKPDEWEFRLIPNQMIKGMYKKENIRDVSFGIFSKDYLKNFNEAAKNFSEGFYAPALRFFIQSYSDPAKSHDQMLLQQFARRCFEKMNQRKEMFDRTKYHEHHKTQTEQGRQLLFLIKEWTDRLGISPEMILDIGSGDGEFTRNVASEFPEAETIGIDPAPKMVMKAKQLKRESDKYSKVKFKEVAVEKYSPSVKFDIVFSNSTMHWIKEQKKAYENIRSFVKEDGLLAVHQGHEGCYKELRDVAEETHQELGFSNKFTDFDYPLVYHTPDKIEKLLNKVGFEIKECYTRQKSNIETLPQDFVEAGLLPYRERLDDVEEQVFIEKFLEKAKNLDSINTTRLYFAATPKKG